MEYTIVTDKSSNKLIELVNQYIKEGWKPIGGICVFTTEAVINKRKAKIFSCYQAMIKE
jgi:hypothetical protein